TDFWRRWHISLSTWFRDYVYIPLGGNRVGKAKHILNLLTVWLLTGLWHGASWNFVLWGLYYFVFLVLEKYVWGKALEKAPSVLRRIYSCAVILFGWFIFASADISSPFGYLASLFSAGGETYDIWRSALILIILALFSTPLPKKLFSSAVSKLGRGREIAVGAAVAAIFLLSLAALAGSDYSPFLYTRF
ncbi:MAG: MBOAT family protein, partial [Clostridiales bacterium]|nr:MBOAT family protein [Clostridiales bacterium]